MKMYLKNINDFFEKNISLILKIFLYLQPIIDILTGIMLNVFHINFTIGMIVKFVFLLFLIYFYLFVRKSISKPRKIYLLIVLLFMITFGFIIYFNRETQLFSYEITQLLKVFYFPLLLTVIEFKDIDLEVNDFVRIGCIYLILIIIPNILNISYNSYTQGKIGSVGLFNSGNEISAILSILTPFLIYYLFQKNSLIKKAIIVILMTFTYFRMGSKIIIIALVLSLILNLILFLRDHELNKKKNIILGVSIILIIILGIYFIPKTNFYYNIRLHLKYLGIYDFYDMFTFNFINRFLFSDRLTYLIRTFNYFINSGILFNLFGVGFVHSIFENIAIFKFIEMDLFDIFFSLGIIGFIIYIIPVGLSIKEYFKIKKKSLFKFSIILALLISILVGHTLIAPSVSIFVVYMLKCNNKGKKI